MGVPAYAVDAAWRASNKIDVPMNEIDCIENAINGYAGALTAQIRFLKGLLDAKDARIDELEKKLERIKEVA